MKSLWIIGFLFIGNQLNAQNIQSDLKLLRIQQANPSYRSEVTGQWGHTCYFEIPCSDFSSQLIQRYGILKGFFLTIDRYGKCNKLSFYETLPNRINAKGKIIDSVRYYSAR
jgi:putative component of membrane protein insertase Oxa1/YidC/SpoIIIJ protein YidD